MFLIFFKKLAFLRSIRKGFNEKDIKDIKESYLNKFSNHISQDQQSIKERAMTKRKANLYRVLIKLQSSCNIGFFSHHLWKENLMILNNSKLKDRCYG